MAAEVRAAAAEEQQKQSQAQLRAAAKVLPGLIESQGVDAIPIMQSLLNLGNQSNVESVSAYHPLSNQVSSVYQFTEHRALRTAEILEMILLHLPMRDLFFGQFVSPYWKSVIDRSRKMQETLAFRPLPDDQKEGAHVFNPLLVEVFGEWFTWSSHYDKFRIPQEYVSYIPMRRSNPDAFLRPEASWRRMRFQNVVASYKKTVVYYKVPYIVMNIRYKRFPSDCTMGEVYDSIKKIADQPAGDDLLWLHFGKPGDTYAGSRGHRAIDAVTRAWFDRQNWYRDYWGIEDNMKLTPNEKQDLKEWRTKYSRMTRARTELATGNSYSNVKKYRFSWIYGQGSPSTG